jgi:SAM-dependent methyltransferase
MSQTKSYTSGKTSFVSLWREARSLHALYSRRGSEGAESCYQEARSIEDLVRSSLSREIRDLDVLDIGPGQFLGCMTYFAVSNRVVGIDLDVIAQHLAPLAYVRMVRANGARRTAKTLIRKTLGFDRRFATNFRRLLGVASLPKLDLRQMDVCEMRFPANSFDFVYSNSVLHHLPEPALALDSIVRVLRPGGVSYIALHPYASDTGCLDPRIFTDRRSEVRGWPHLRPSLQNTVGNPNAYVNKLRLEQWRTLFMAKMPSVQFILTPSLNADVEGARTLQSQGELLDYSIEELCTGKFAALWVKPLSASTPQA